MIKKIICILCMSLMVIGFCACSNNVDTKTLLNSNILGLELPDGYKAHFMVGSTVVNIDGNGNAIATLEDGSIWHGTYLVVRG